MLCRDLDTGLGASYRNRLIRQNFQRIGMGLERQRAIAGDRLNSTGMREQGRGAPRDAGERIAGQGFGDPDPGARGVGAGGV